MDIAGLESRRGNAHPLFLTPVGFHPGGAEHALRWVRSQVLEEGGAEAGILDQDCARPETFGGSKSTTVDKPNPALLARSGCLMSRIARVARH